MEQLFRFEDNHKIFSDEDFTVLTEKLWLNNNKIRKISFEEIDKKVYKFIDELCDQEIINEIIYDEDFKALMTKGQKRRSVHFRCRSLDRRRLVLPR